MLSRSFSRSSSHQLRYTVHPVQYSLPRTQPHLHRKSQKQEQIKSLLQRAFSHKTHPPVMETPPQHPFQRATLLDSSPVSWVKVSVVFPLYFMIGRIIWFGTMAKLELLLKGLSPEPQNILNTFFFFFFLLCEQSYKNPGFSVSVCTQLLVSRPDEENISCYLQLIEKCLSHEVRSRTCFPLVCLMYSFKWVLPFGVCWKWSWCNFLFNTNMTTWLD